MTLFSKLLAAFFCLMLVAAVLYVLFGQITVRKLRKNPSTKGTLGFEYVSGWDIINVAQALALPRAISSKLRRGQLAFLAADPELLHKHTTVFDRALAATFYWTLMISGLGGALLVLLNSLGVFER